jgi:uncharacterized protein (DUF608 family)
MGSSKIIDEIGDSLGVLNRFPDLSRDIRDAIVEAISDTDHYEVLISFRSNDVAIALNDAIQIQLLRERHEYHPIFLLCVLEEIALKFPISRGGWSSRRPWLA